MTAGLGAVVGVVVGAVLARPRRPQPSPVSVDPAPSSAVPATGDRPPRSPSRLTGGLTSIVSPSTPTSPGGEVGAARYERSVVDALIDVLAVLRTVAVVATSDLTVVRATSAAYGLGLVQADSLRHDELRALVADSFDSAQVCEAELELARGLVGNASMVVSARATPVGDGIALLMLEDRSEARRVEEVRRDFVANVSHELKTPVGAISLLAETMADAADDPVAIRHFAARMQKEAERLSRLVHEIIELSRLQTVDALTSSELLDLDRLVRDAVDQARWRADAHEIDIEVVSTTGLRTYGDHDLLVTAVRNLLDNAITYSPPRTTVSVDVRRDDGFVEIRVTDRGHGIPLAEQSRIFERFYRIDPARSRATGGTGLGLAIVKHVAENHGGEATVHSVPSRGSTFALRLPVGTAPVARPVHRHNGVTVGRVAT
jgi:two-component system sensor histidine kinase SenX3